MFRYLIKYRNISFDIFSLFSIPILLHFIYSKYGFNPTDDGLDLATYRRIIDGLVPHKDFISNKPIGSLILHLPTILFSTDYLYLISRFIVLIQFTAICLIWINIFSKVLKTTISNFNKLLILISSVLLTVHTFPLMLHQTVDGLFFISFGLILIFYNSITAKYLGYFILGWAYVCKQSFLFVPFGVLVVFNDYKNIRNIICIILPGILYLSLIFLMGAFKDFFIQINAGGTSIILLKITYSYFLNHLVLIGFIISSSINTLRNKNISVSGENKFNEIIVNYLTIGFYMIWIFFFGLNLIVSDFHGLSWLLFGGIAGILYTHVIQPSANIKFALLFSIVILLAWSVSLSIGYRQTTFVSGILFISFIFYIQQNIKVKYLKYFTPSLLGLTLIFAFVFHKARMTNVYRDRPAGELTFNLAGVLPGGNGIYTNANTYNVLVDLNEAINKIDGTKYSIVPDMAGYWPVADQSNPLSADWIQSTEVPLGEPLNRVKREMVQFVEDGGKIILQKFRAHALGEGIIPIENYKYFNDYHPIVPYIKSNFNELDRSKYFEIYGQNRSFIKK